MSFDRVLAILSFLISIPGLLVFFLTDRATVGVLGLLLGMLLLVGAWAVNWFRRLPEFTMASVDVTLKFDPTGNGERAQLIKDYRIRPNSSHSKQIIHRNIAADGEVRNICWNGDPVPSANIRKIMGEYEVRIDFPAPCKFWHEFDGRLTYDVLDSFSRSQENLWYVADFTAKRVTITVEFPPRRPCKEVSASYMAGGERPLDSARRLQDGLTARMVIKRPINAAQYVLHWRW